MHDHRAWYNTLHKPGWTPAPRTIGRIWSILYPIILVCAVWTLTLVVAGDISAWAGVAVVANLVSNIAFTPIQFGLRRLGLASIDILVILATIAWWMRLAWPASPWLSVALAPYLLWVGIATVLMVSIWWRNR